MNFCLIVIGAVLIIDTLIILLRSNLNIGVVLPSILGAPLFLYGIFYDELNAFFTTQLGTILKIAITAIYLIYLVLTIISICVIAFNANRQADKGANAIIVLGAAVHGRKISLTLKNRLDLAIKYFNEMADKNAVIVVSGAKGRQEDVSEAIASKEYLISRGIDERRILAEECATNTFENFTFSKKILDDYFKDRSYTAVFITNNFHVYRAGLAAKKAGLDIRGMGCKAKLYIQPNNYLRESLAVIKYWIVGAK